MEDCEELVTLAINESRTAFPAKISALVLKHCLAVGVEGLMMKGSRRTLLASSREVDFSLSR